MGIVVADESQGKGVGTFMLNTLLDIAVERGKKKMYVEVLTTNWKMMQLMHFMASKRFHTTSSREDKYSNSICN